MLGPLPRIYRIVVTVTSLLLFVGGGAWAAYTVPYPVLVSAGAGVGLAVGGVAAYLLLHTHRPTAGPRHARRHRLY